MGRTGAHDRQQPAVRPPGHQLVAHHLQHQCGAGAVIHLTPGLCNMYADDDQDNHGSQYGLQEEVQPAL